MEEGGISSQALPQLLWLSGTGMGLRKAVVVLRQCLRNSEVAGMTAGCPLHLPCVYLRFMGRV